MGGQSDHRWAYRAAHGGRRTLAALGLATGLVLGLMVAGAPAARADQPYVGAQLDAQHQYVQDYAKKPGVELTTDGVAYRFLRKGPPVGPQPTPDGRVRVHYEGKLINGTIFDSSYQRDETAVMSLTKVIPAWQEVIPLMHVGDKVEMVVPAEMGYGQRGSPDGGIPPGATLIFKVELFEVLPKEVGPKH